MKAVLIILSVLLVGWPVGLRAELKALGGRHVPGVVRQQRVRSQGRLAASQSLQLSLGLPLHHQAELAALLQDLYNPASTNYHHYLTPAQFTARFGPTPAEYAQVLAFAATNHLRVTATYANRQVVSVKGMAADVEHAFHVQLQTFSSPAEQRNFYAPTSEPTVDARLPLQSVTGLDNYRLPHPLLRTTALGGAVPLAGSGPAGTYLGADFRQAYVPGTALTGAGQAVGLLEFDGYNLSDITNYAGAAGLTNLPLTNVLLDGVSGSPGSGNVEVCLDIDMVLSMAPGLTNVLVYEGSNPFDVLNQMATDDAAAQLSSSWAWGGGPDATIDGIFAQMAAQGQSFFQAAGDSDAYTPATMDNVFDGDAPVDNPLVTTVGGTELTTTGPGGSLVSETTWNWYTGTGTGGGTSLYYPLPYWQAGVNMTANGGSTTYRNIPDVALTAENIYVVYNSGTSGGAAGTSCAAPLWAAFTALVNQQGATLGQPSAGFINPALYALARGTNYGMLFNDVTTGDNTSTASPTNFYAGPGYDLCTGWGTPNGTNLINALTTPDYLGLPAGTNLTSTGPVGGPFTVTNWVVTLTNTGPGALAWSLGSLPAWLAVSPASGTLAAGAGTNLTLSLTGANGLPPGNFTAVLEVTNITEARVDIAAVITVTVDPSLVLNGGFETGDFTDWTLVGDTVVGSNIYNVVVTEAEFSGTVHSGYYGAFLGEGGYVATLSQTLPTTPGTLYQVSCWLNNPLAYTNQIFNASWAGSLFVTLTNPPAVGWTNLTYVATATATNTVLEFGAENDLNYFGFDDVSVQAVPPVAFTGLQWATNGLQMTWFSLPALNYEVQYATNLSTPAWVALASVTAVTNVTSLTDTNVFGGDAARFYQLILLP